VALKLDYATDLADLTKSVEKVYPLWLFRFLSPTDHEVGKADRPGERFLLLWLKRFEALRKEFEAGIRTVLRSPHQRLESNERFLRADRIHGRISPRLEQAIALQRSHSAKRYRVEQHRSSLDTPENRFVKHVLEQVASRLERIEILVKDRGVSSGFRGDLASWSRAAKSFSASPLFRVVGDFEGLSQESLVLHHRAGYSAVYRTWLQLREYLEFFARTPRANIGMREISELYELWCFLELRRILLTLGFVEDAPSRAPRMRRRDLETELENGLGAAFHLYHVAAGIYVRLAHEPVFGTKGTEGIHSYTVSQKPDIVLEATWNGSTAPRRLLWVFDAKYRVKTSNDDRDDSRSLNNPLVPPDALDQMHRYRDSLILRHAQDGGKSRPVIGAYALYPGFLSQADSDNPYAQAIHEVGIGAFPLLPAPGHDLWLREHLRVALGLPEPATPAEDPATLLAQENVRIPVTGLEYRDEVLVVPIGKDRTSGYVNAFASGNAHGYHIDVEGGPSQRRLASTRWLAAIATVDGRREIRGMYRISSCKTRKRSSLGEAESGSGWKRERDVHWLSLENWIPLESPLVVEGWMGGNWFRYFDRSLLEKARDFHELGSAP
jgi:predicted component of viral defense system (DUF524 family)